MHFSMLQRLLSQPNKTNDAGKVKTWAVLLLLLLLPVSLPMLLLLLLLLPPSLPMLLLLPHPRLSTGPIFHLEIKTFEQRESFKGGQCQRRTYKKVSL